MRSRATGRVSYKSGLWVPEEELAIHPYDEQFMYGTGVFEMWRTFNHDVFLLNEHIDRLFASMRSFYIPVNKTREEIASIILELMERNGEQFNDDEYRIMVNVSRGPLPIYREVFELDEGERWGDPTWIFNAWPLSKTAKHLAHFYDTGVNAVLVHQRQIPAQFLDPKVKNRSRAHYKLADIEASHFGQDAVALLLDDQGFIAEGTGSNFLMVSDGCIVVPEMRNMLRGCSMMYILDVIANQLDLHIVEANIEPYDVLCADEAMFAGTFNNVLPCNRFNGRQLKGREGSREPMGPVTRAICEQWSRNVNLDFISQIRTWGARA